MRLLVTGFHGTVGSGLGKAARKRGHEPIAWDRSIAPPGDWEASRRFVSAVRPDALFHLAVASSPTGAPNEGWLVGEKWSADLAALGRDNGIPFVFTSTVMVYTNRIPGPLTPEVEPDETQGYGWSKLEAERLCRGANPESRIARLGWQIGDGPGGNNMVDHLERQASSGTIWASTEWLPGTSYVEDTADALLDLIAMPAGTYHVGSNHEWSFYEIVLALNRRHGSRWQVRPNQDFVLDQRLLDARLPLPRLEQRLPLAHARG